MTFIHDDSPEDREGSPPVFTVAGDFPNDVVITYGGHKLERVKSMHIYMDANGLPQVDITLQPGKLDIDTATFLAMFAHGVSRDQYDQIKAEHDKLHGTRPLPWREDEFDDPDDLPF